MSNIAATLSLNVPAITALCLGQRGSIIFAASGLPDNPNNAYSGNPGLSGDFYIDTSTGLYYGPKTTSWPTAALFSLNAPTSSFAYTLVSGTTSLIIPQYGNNRIRTIYNNSAILGGQNNSLSGNNSFIIGSNITAAVTGFTLVNNLSSTGIVYASAGNSNQWSSAFTIVSSNSANWNNGYTTLQSVSAQSNATWTAVSPNSANWNNTYTSITANSGNWSSAYTVLTSYAYLTYSLNPGLSSIVPTRGTFTMAGTASNIGGGNFNKVLSSYSSVVGGQCNTTNGLHSNIGGGCCNTAAAPWAFIGGGSTNSITPASAVWSVIGGGCNNTNSGTYSFIGGGGYNTTSGSYTSIVGGTSNISTGWGASVGGGSNNTASGGYSVIGGGQLNVAACDYSVVLGGLENKALSAHSVVITGCCNVTRGTGAVIGGGCCNTASGQRSTILNGDANIASGNCSTILGGLSNVASGPLSFIAGGSNNNARSWPNVYILGSSLSASQINYTYVNNLSSQGSVAASGGNSTQWNAAYTTTASGSANWSNAYTFLNTNTAAQFTVNNLIASGTGTINSTLAVNDNATIGFINGSSTGLYLTKGATYGVPAIQGVTTAFGVGQNIAINPNGGNIGIGTTSPTVKLDVAGNQILTASTTPTLLLNNTVGTTWNTELGFGSNGTRKWSIGVDPGAQGVNKLYFYDNAFGATRLLIDASGNVGIGTSSPSQALTVAGNIRAGAANTAYLGDAFTLAGGYRHLVVGTSYYDGTNYITPAPGSNAVANVATDTNGIAFFTTGSTGATIRTDSPATFAAYERVRIDASGNVGIGATSPATKLQVSGEANFTTVSETKATPAITANVLTLNLSTATLFYVTLNANIGTLTLSNAPASPRVFSFTLQLVGDGTQRTISWPAAVRWQGGITPTPTATLNKVDTFVFFTHDGGSNYFAFIAGQNA
jgi:hypothetical protein